MFHNPYYKSGRVWRLSASVVAILLGSLAAGCSTHKPLVYSQEKFDSVTRHSRSFGMSAERTCEAARRALLSNGYQVQRPNPELVNGRKSFQPSGDTHVEIEFHVVCAAEGSQRSTVFVNALQDRYALKKTSNSASLGVGPVGSVSLPFGSSSDSLVKIASETIPSGDFYDRFFALIEDYLARSTDDAPDEPAAVDSLPLPPARSSPGSVSDAGAPVAVPSPVR
jgi:hypothetical protein